MTNNLFNFYSSFERLFNWKVAVFANFPECESQRATWRCAGLGTQHLSPATRDARRLRLVVPLYLLGAEECRCVSYGGNPVASAGTRAYSIMWNSGSTRRMAGSRRDWRVRTPHENIEGGGILEVYCRLGLLWGTWAVVNLLVSFHQDLRVPRWIMILMGFYAGRVTVLASFIATISLPTKLILTFTASTTVHAV